MGIAPPHAPFFSPQPLPQPQVRNPQAIASKINDTPKGVYLPIIKKFVTAVKFHYRVLQLTAVFLTPLGVSFILLAAIV